MSQDQFEILGYNVRFNSSADGEEQGRPSAHEVVELVKSEADKIAGQAPQLSEGKVAVLVALKIASDMMTMENNYNGQFGELHHRAKNALAHIDELIPRQI